MNINEARAGLLAGNLNYLLASIFWGLNIPLTAALLKSVDPFWLSPNRYVVATAVLLLWVIATLGPKCLRSPVPWRRVLLLSLLVSCFLTLFNLGILYTHPVTAAAVIAGSPVYVAVISRVVFRTRLERGFMGAALLTIVGAGIAIAGRTDLASSGFRLQGGEFLLVVAIVFWTLYSIYAQRWFPRETPQLQRTYLTSLLAIPCMYVIWLLARIIGIVGAPNLAPEPRALAYLIITAVCASALATVAWNNGVARLGITAGAMWQNTVPVFAVLISLLFFGVVPSGAQVLGGAVVMAGVLYMQIQALRTKPS